MFSYSRLTMRSRVLLKLIVIGVLIACPSELARASMLWNWTYSGPGISAQGTFTTVDTADVSGLYLITGITGIRNGLTITGLQPAGTPIPGNEPYDVDNLVRIGTTQLTKNGFGFSISGGIYSNPFFADFLTPPVYLEFFSSPPFSDSMGPEDSELEIQFSATPVPEPGTAVLMSAGTVLMLLVRRRSSERQSSR